MLTILFNNRVGHNKKDDLIKPSFFVELLGGIEPPTPGFSVLCSTN